MKILHKLRKRIFSSTVEDDKIIKCGWPGKGKKGSLNDKGSRNEGDLIYDIDN